MGLSVETLVLARKYTRDTVNGLGALKGASCQIQSISEIEGGHLVTFSWTATDGTIQTSEMAVLNGASGNAIENVQIDNNRHLICTMSDGTKIDAGALPTSTVAGNIWVGTKEEYIALPVPLPEDTVVIFTDDGSGEVAPVDSSVMFLNRNEFPITGEQNKIYVALDEEATYIYKDSYVNISSGEISSIELSDIDILFL